MRRYVLPTLALIPFLASAGVQAQTDAAPAPAPGVSAPKAKAAAAPRRVMRRAAHTANSQAGQYFVEFRSRYALSYGHTFLVHGRLNANGEVGTLTAANVAGFHPAGAGPELWSLGHVVPVLSETGPSDGDLEEQYVSARYRVLLSEAQYRKVAAYIRQKQAAKVPWHAVAYNCNAWVGDVARSIGLKTPLNHLLYPADYINAIKQLNTEGEVSMATRT